jgi:hypothetical protein
MMAHHPLLAAMEEIERKLDALCAENTPKRKGSDMTDHVQSSDDEDTTEEYTVNPQPQASAPPTEAQALEAELDRVARATSENTWTETRQHAIERITNRGTPEVGTPVTVTLFGFPVHTATNERVPTRLWRIGFQQPPSAKIIQLIIVLWNARWINTIKSTGKTDDPLFDGYAQYNVGDYSVKVVGYDRFVIRTLADLEAIMQTRY